MAAWVRNVGTFDLRAARFNGTNWGPLALLESLAGFVGQPADISPQFRQVGGHDMEVRHFVECVVQGKEPLATGEHGFYIDKIMYAIYKSTETGKGVEISW